jgi:hypothetical protein
MSKTRTLGTIVAGVVCALGLVGCNQTDYTQHNYSAFVDTDSVSFNCQETSGWRSKDKTFENKMLVFKPDGRVIEYNDAMGSDLYIETIIVRIPEKGKSNGSWLTGEEKSTYSTSAEPYPSQTKTYYAKNTADAKIISEGQKDFKAKFDKLQEIREQEGLNLIK